PLQEAVFEVLDGDQNLAALVSGIYDAAPQQVSDAAEDGLYVTIGDELAEDWATASDAGAVHTVLISVHAPRRGFAEAKRAAGLISDLMLSAVLVPARGRVIQTRFLDARTARAENDALRRIDLRFRLTLEDS
ncbi:MAG: DUF3168 domain-containing protein, partial [Pseudomonadota bacterium]